MADDRTYTVALTQQELEAGLWCLNALSLAWLGSPNGTAIHGLKEKLKDAHPTTSKEADPCVS